MSNISDNNCRENRNIRFKFNKFFRVYEEWNQVVGLSSQGESLLLGKIDPPRTGSHLLRSTTIILCRSSLPRDTGFHELGTPLPPLTLLHHQIDIIQSSDICVYVYVYIYIYIYIYILLRCSKSKLWKFARCNQLLLLCYVQPDDGHRKGRNM